MKILLVGGSKSGKSGLAQRLCVRLAAGAPMIYWATMEPVDGEDRARIARHLDERAGWGFSTVECGRALERAALPERTESIARQRRLLAQAQELLRAIDGVQLLGAQEAPHILNLAVPGVRSQGLINALQERDIYVSAGSACSKGHRSHVLEAMGVDAAWIDGSVRVSLSDETTEDDIRALAEALPAVLTELRGGGRRA